MIKYIEILKFSEKNFPTKKGGYCQADVSYVDLETGKTEGKKIMDFTYPEVYGLLKKANVGDRFKIESAKLPGSDGKEYWNWISAETYNLATTPPVNQTKSSVVPSKPHYQTPEEKARIQVYIIRQSSVASAVNLCREQGKQPNVDEILIVAKKFEDYVLGQDTDMLTDTEIE